MTEYHALSMIEQIELQEKVKELQAEVVNLTDRLNKQWWIEWTVKFTEAERVGAIALKRAGEIEQLQAEITELKAANLKIMRGDINQGDYPRECGGNDEYVQDAKRYKFLRRMSNEPTVMDYLNAADEDPETPELFDAAIDLAILASERKGEVK